MTSRAHRMFGSMALFIGLALSLAPHLAYADNTQCTGVLTGTFDNVVVPPGADCTLSGAHVLHNVRVESGASLLATIGPLGSTTIGGNVHGIHSKFVLLVFQTQVGGNFHAHGGDAGTTTGFDIGVTIGGNATIEMNAGRTFVDAATVGGQLNVWRNTGCAVEVEFNTVGGHIRIEDNVIGIVPVAECPFPPVGGPTVDTGMSIFHNTAATGNLFVLRNSGSGVKQVTTNTVGKTLFCSDNDEPFVGGPNTATRIQGTQCF